MRLIGVVMTKLAAAVRGQRGLSTLGVILVIVLIFWVLGAWPGFSGHGYGVGPSSIGVVLLLIVVVLLVTGRL